MDVLPQLFAEFHSLDFVRKLAVAAIPAVFAITVHEVAHGWAAKIRGDRTAEMLGRLTLNPIKHVDPIGTVLVPGLAVLFTGFFFGWAKPVPVTVENLKGRRRDMAFVAAAGPMANVLMALFWTGVMLVARLSWDTAPDAASFLLMVGFAGVLYNLFIGALNLLPVPPLDGGSIVSSYLPGPLAWQFERIAPFGIFIIFGALLLGVLQVVIVPPVIAALRFLVGLVF